MALFPKYILLFQSIVLLYTSTLHINYGEISFMFFMDLSECFHGFDKSLLSFIQIQAFSRRLD